jgi:two-component system, cell cycle response regulator
MAGDKVLNLAASRMLSIMRAYDSIGRYGGEEFLIVLPGTDRVCAAAIAERLRLIIACNCMNIPEGMIPITISLGVMTYDKGRPCDVNILVKSADIALYSAKEKGRNRVEFAIDNSINKLLNYYANTSSDTRKPNE